MPENIEKIETDELIIREGKEAQGDVLNSEIIKEDNESSKRELLKGIKSKGVEVKEETNTQLLNNDGGKISNIVKQFYSFGVKAIEKVIKSLTPYEIDEVHDKITEKNKKQ